MADEIGMAIVGADGKILDEYSLEKWKEEMERVSAILSEFLNNEHDHIAEGGKKEGEI